MSSEELKETIKQDTIQFQQIHRQSINYQDKYKKSLGQIKGILHANKQIKQELDHLRLQKNLNIEGIHSIQKQQFQKSYEKLLKEKSQMSFNVQNLQMQNQKLRYTNIELQNQVTIFKNQSHKMSERQTLSIGQKQKETESLIKQKQQQYRKTLQQYEEHHSNLIRNNRRLEERISDFQIKIITGQKSWKNKHQAKQIEFVETKTIIRHEFQSQIENLRRENGNLRLENSNLALKIQNLERNISSQPDKYDWEAQLSQDLLSLRTNMEPLRQQVAQLQEMNFYQREQSIRDKANLQAKVMELESQTQRLVLIIHEQEKKQMNNFKEKHQWDEKIKHIKHLQEQNHILHGKIVVLESREMALKNRDGDELEERISQFEMRIQMLLSNKQNLKDLREVGIHQLLALKAYIYELDAKLKEVMNTNTYIMRKYKSYKEKYQSSIKEQKQYSLLISNLKVKIMGYDKLVIKLQGELQRNMRSNEGQMLLINQRYSQEDSKVQIYKKKYLLMKEKLELADKYHSQQIETIKLSYETKLMDMTVRVEETRSLKETIELYKSKNEDLQSNLSQKEGELIQARLMTSSKIASVDTYEIVTTNTKQTKQIINNLHFTIQQNDESLFKLQSQLRNKEETYKKNLRKIQKEKDELQEQINKILLKKDMENNLFIEQQNKKHRHRISELQSQVSMVRYGLKDDEVRRIQEFQSKIRRLESNIREVEMKNDEQIFTKRRLQKQVIDLNSEKQDLLMQINSANRSINQFQLIIKEKDDLIFKFKESVSTDRSNFAEIQVQNKQIIIKRLTNDINEMKERMDDSHGKDIAISSLRNQVFYLKKEIEELNQTLNQYSNEISYLKTTMEGSRTSYNTGVQQLIEEKDAQISKLRKQNTNKDRQISDLQLDFSQKQQQIRRLQRQIANNKDMQLQLNQLKSNAHDKQFMMQKAKVQGIGMEDQYQRVKKQLIFVKDNYQNLKYELLQKEDIISRMNVQMSTLSIKGKDDIERRYMDEIDEKDRTISKYTFEISSIKNTMVNVEQDKNYLEESNRKLNSDIFQLRSMVTQLEIDNSQIKDELTFKQQTLSRIQLDYSTQKSELQDVSQQAQQLYKIKTEIFTLKTQVDNLTEELREKDQKNNKANSEIYFLKDQLRQVEEQYSDAQNNLNRLNFQFISSKSLGDQTQNNLSQKQAQLMRLNHEQSSLKNKYRELEEEMEQRENEFSIANAEMHKIKTDLALKDDQVQSKNMQIARMSKQNALLREEITKLNEELTNKSHDINRLNQEIFMIKMDFNDKDYNQKIKLDQEMFNYKNQIEILRNDVNDREGDIQRLKLEIEGLKMRPTTPVPMFSEQEVEQMRSELNKKNRQLINMRFEMDDYKFKIQSLQSQLSSSSKAIKELDERRHEDTGNLEEELNQARFSQRRLRDQVRILENQIEFNSKPAMNIVSSNNGGGMYSEEQMMSVREQIAKKQREISSIKIEFEDRTYIISNQQNTINKQNQLIAQLENHLQETTTHMQAQINQLIAKLRQSQYPQLQQQQLIQPQDNSGGPSIQAYLLQIDRLNEVILDLQDEINQFKLKLSQFVNQQTRIEEQLVTMVVLFAEIESLRDKMTNKESEIKQIRKSFIQMTVAGEVSPDAGNRLGQMVNLATESRERLTNLESVYQEQGNIQATSKEVVEIQNFELQNSKQPSVQNSKGTGGSLIVQLDRPEVVRQTKKNFTITYQNSSQAIHQSFPQQQQIRQNQVIHHQPPPGHFQQNSNIPHIQQINSPPPGIRVVVPPPHQQVIAGHGRQQVQHVVHRGPQIRQL